MKERSFDEMIAYFNRRVSEMDIAQDYKMELLGMVTALGYKHEKTAQQERKTGKWRAFKIGECDLIECTACKVARPREEMPRRNGGKIAWKYCPECGAKMEE